MDKNPEWKNVRLSQGVYRLNRLLSGGSCQGGFRVGSSEVLTIEPDRWAFRMESRGYSLKAWLKCFLLSNGSGFWSRKLFPRRLTEPSCRPGFSNLRRNHKTTAGDGIVAPRIEEKCFDQMPTLVELCEAIKGLGQRLYFSMPSLDGQSVSTRNCTTVPAGPAAAIIAKRLL